VSARVCVICVSCFSWIRVTRHQPRDEPVASAPSATQYSKGELLRIYDPVCSQIADFLYLGSRCPAMSRDLLKATGITHILNCAGTICENYFPDEFQYTTLALVDGSTEDLDCLFYYVLELFEEVRASGQRIFVHW
jgi:hypothetical protein